MHMPSLCNSVSFWQDRMTVSPQYLFAPLNLLHIRPFDSAQGDIIR